MTEMFGKATYQYFESAGRNRKNRAWFEKNSDAYEDSVRTPFRSLIDRIHSRFAGELPKVNLSPRRIVPPLRQVAAKEKGCVRSQATAYLAESATSQYEYNPGIFISIGTDDNDNLLRVGLYRVSSRQMRRLRRKLTSDFGAIDALLTNRRLKSRLGDLAGEVFKRFPTDGDPESPAAKYLLHKNFYLDRKFTRAEVTSHAFAASVIADIECSLAFLQWLRKAVGTYERP